VRVHGGADRGQAGAVFAEALQQLDHVAGMQALRQLRGPAVSGGVDPGHVGVRGADRIAGLEGLLRQPPEVLDEGELEHARPCPQLADRQGSHGLVAVHEAHELLAVQAAVAVADELDGHRVDPGIARPLPERQLRQLSVVAGGKAPADVEDLGRHEMEVVEDPFLRGSHELAAVHVLGHGEVRLAQDAGVVLEARQDVARGASGARVESEPGGEGARALLQTLDAQELVAQRPLGRRGGSLPEEAEQ
jgi:hypothetical protein